MAGNKMLLGTIAIAVSLTAVLASEKVAIVDAKSTEDQQTVNLLEEVDSRAVVGNVSGQLNPFDYITKVSMINYGAAKAKVQQRYLFPDGVEVTSYTLKQDGYRAKRSAANQRFTQWVGGMVNLKPSEVKEADMTYINHPAQVINPSTKTFHKLSTAILIKEGDLVGGQISSPNYPLSYPDGADLTWLIAYPDGNIVKLELEDYSTEECCDRLIVYNGYNKSHIPIATFEGNYFPGPDNIVFSSSPAMFIRFTSDCLGTNRGFRATYVNQRKNEAPVMPCGNVQQTSSNAGYIQSPNYPGTYDQGMNCTWPVQTDYNTRVKFVMNNFSIGYDDRVEIYEGTPSSRGSNIVSLSGNYYNGYTVYASSNEAFVIFSSGSSTYYSNLFLISYEGDFNSPETTTSAPMSCGYVHTSGGNSGYFESPNYPGTYDPNMNCTWSVQTYYNTRVKFFLDNVYIGSDDRLEFYDGTPSSPGYRITYLSGVSLSYYTIYATSYQAFAVFTSGYSSYYYNKFYVSYGGEYSPSTTASSPVSCGSIIFTGSYEGNIASPNYPSTYPSDALCLWAVTTVYGTRVQFRVDYFSLPSGDYVYIYDGTPTSSSSLVQSMSGYYSSGYTVTTSYNNALLQFDSDSYSQSSSYKFQFSFSGTNEATTHAPYEETTDVVDYNPSPCNGSSYPNYISSSHIDSPGYYSPGYYPMNQDCIWYVSTSSSYDAIRFYPHYFSTEYGYDWVRIYNGYSTSQGNLIAEMSGYVDPYTTLAVSNSRYATLTFSSDGIIADVGFSIHNYGTYYSNYYSTTASPEDSGSGSGMNTCTDSYYSGYSGYVQSPNYPYNYYNNMDCSTWINTPYGTTVTLTVQSFNLNYGDYVTVYNAFNNQYLQRFSGYYSYGYTWYSSTSYIRLVFISDSYYTASGYYLRYDYSYNYYYTTASPSNCGEEMPYNSGIITSPNYPSDYYDNTDCLWTVYVSTNKYVLFTVDFFNTESCCDYVSFYGGSPTNSSGSYAQLAGYVSPGYEILIQHNQAYVTFHSDYSVTNSGFSISYNAVPTYYVSANNPTTQAYGNEPYTSWERSGVEGAAEESPRTIGKDLWANAKNKPDHLRRIKEHISSGEKVHPKPKGLIN